jgi:hypothetical protein
MSYDCCDPILPDPVVLPDPFLAGPDWTMQGPDISALLDTSTGPIPNLTPMTGDITPLMDVIDEIGRQNSIMLGHDPTLDFSSGDADSDGIIDSADAYNVTYDPPDSYDSYDS